jgi:prepilin peptidase CpaA
MEFTDSIELTKVLLLISLLMLCTATDISTRRIPNDLLLPALMTALFLNSVQAGLTGLADSVGGLVLGVVMLLPLYLLGRMGAGDLKLLGVVGSILGAWGAIVAGLATMIAGGILGVLYLVWLVVKPKVVSQLSRLDRFNLAEKGAPDFEMPSRSVRVAEIPYAVAITAGTFMALLYLDLLTEVSIT